MVQLANLPVVAQMRTWGRVPLAAAGITALRSISKTIAETLRPANESRRAWPAGASLKAEARLPFWPGVANVANSAVKPSASKKNGSLRKPAKMP